MIITEKALQHIFVDYADGYAHIGDKKVPAGTFSFSLLNTYEKYDLDVKLPDASVGLFEAMLRDNLDSADREMFRSTGNSILQMLKLLRVLKPFDQLASKEQAEEITYLFSDEPFAVLDTHNRLIKARQINPDMTPEDIHRLFPMTRFPEYSRAYNNTRNTLKNVCGLFEELPSDMEEAYYLLKTTADRYPENPSNDISALVSGALSEMYSSAVRCCCQYVPIANKSKKHPVSVGNRLVFERYIHFVIADFFEGLKYNHYPRKCIVCGRYFLVTNAKECRICGGYYEGARTRDGRKISCRQFAANKQEREKKGADPVIQQYTRVRASIRQDFKRGKISEALCETAKALAEDCKELALSDSSYADGEYLEDIKKENLYKEAERAILGTGAKK